MNKDNKQVLSNDKAYFIYTNHVKGLNIKAKPYSLDFRYDNDGNVDQVRIYGGDGYVICDYDLDDHGYSDKHPYKNHYGAHKHIWTRNEEGYLKHGDHEAMTDREYNIFVKPFKNNK